MVSPQDKYRSIAPGQTIEFEFTLNYPGHLHVPLRHADDPRAHRLGHVRRGDRRAARRLPDEGRPRVRGDPERVLRQADPASSKVDGAPLYVLDSDRCARAQPTHTVFNGAHNGMVKTPLAAKPGERVRSTC
jgi:nitrite reductase (NO-forming)